MRIEVTQSQDSQIISTLERSVDVQIKSSDGKIVLSQIITPEKPLKVKNGDESLFEVWFQTGFGTWAKYGQL